MPFWHFLKLFLSPAGTACVCALYCAAVWLGTCLRGVVVYLWCCRHNIHNGSAIKERLKQPDRPTARELTHFKVKVKVRAETSNNLKRQRKCCDKVLPLGQRLSPRLASFRLTGNGGQCFMRNQPKIQEIQFLCEQKEKETSLTHTHTHADE